MACTCAALQVKNFVSIRVERHIAHLADCRVRFNKLIQEVFCRRHCSLIACPSAKGGLHRVGDIHHDHNSHIGLLIALFDRLRGLHCQRNVKHVLQLSTGDRLADLYAVALAACHFAALCIDLLCRGHRTLGDGTHRERRQRHQRIFRLILCGVQVSVFAVLLKVAACHQSLPGRKVFNHLADQVVFLIRVCKHIGDPADHLGISFPGDLAALISRAQPRFQLLSQLLVLIRQDVSLFLQLQRLDLLGKGRLVGVHFFQRQRLLVGVGAILGVGVLLHHAGQLAVCVIAALGVGVCFPAAVVSGFRLLAAVIVVLVFFLAAAQHPGAVAALGVLVVGVGALTGQCILVGVRHHLGVKALVGMLVPYPLDHAAARVHAVALAIAPCAVLVHRCLGDLAHQLRPARLLIHAKGAVKVLQHIVRGAGHFRCPLHKAFFVLSVVHHDPAALVLIVVVVALALSLNGHAKTKVLVQTKRCNTVVLAVDILRPPGALVAGVVSIRIHDHIAAVIMDVGQQLIHLAHQLARLRVVAVHIVLMEEVICHPADALVFQIAVAVALRGMLMGLCGAVQHLLLHGRRLAVAVVRMHVFFDLAAVALFQGDGRQDQRIRRAEYHDRSQHRHHTAPYTFTPVGVCIFLRVRQKLVFHFAVPPLFQFTKAAQRPDTEHDLAYDLLLRHASDLGMSRVY